MFAPIAASHGLNVVIARGFWKPFSVRSCIAGRTVAALATCGSLAPSVPTPQKRKRHRLQPVLFSSTIAKIPTKTPRPFGSTHFSLCAFPTARDRNKNAGNAFRWHRLQPLRHAARPKHCIQQQQLNADHSLTISTKHSPTEITATQKNPV